MCKKWKMHQFFFSSDFDEFFFGNDSDDFKKKKFLLLRKEKCHDFLLIWRWARTCSHESPQSKSMWGPGAQPRWGVWGGQSPPHKNGRKKNFDNNFCLFFKVHFFSFKIVWFVPKNFKNWNRTKKKISHIFPRFSKKLLTFSQKVKFPS